MRIALASRKPGADGAHLRAQWTPPEPAPPAGPATPHDPLEPSRPPHRPGETPPPDQPSHPTVRAHFLRGAPEKLSGV